MAKLALQVFICQLIIIQIFLNILFYLHYMGWIKPKNHSRYCPFNNMNIWCVYNCLESSFLRVDM
jgi:hypothetical protein